MGKILGSWSGMRKYLEQEMLCDRLRGRVRYGCTRYTGMDNCHIFDINVDGKQMKRFSLETVNSYFISQGLHAESAVTGTAGYWNGFWENMDTFPMSVRSEYTDTEFCGALKKYRELDITESIASSDPIVRMFAVLDRRTGKRSLERIKSSIDEYSDWLCPFLELRLS